MFEQIFFYFFAFLAVVTALLVVFQKDPVRSALFLVACFLQVAALYLLLRSPFLAVVQVFVYVGAVVVLFLFVIMVLELKKEKIGEYLHIDQRPWAFLLMIVFLIEVIYLMSRGGARSKLGPYTEELLIKEGSTEVLGTILFTKYLFPFEVVSLLLLIALVGAILLTHKRG